MTPTLWLLASLIAFAIGLCAGLRPRDRRQARTMRTASAPLMERQVTSLRSQAGADARTKRFCQPTDTARIYRLR